MESSNFSDLQVHQEIKQLLEDANFKKMTEVQSSVIPEFMRKDVIVQSQTGSGKTLAYLVPIINKLYTLSSKTASGKPISYPVSLIDKISTQPIDTLPSPVHIINSSSTEPNSPDNTLASPAQIIDKISTEPINTLPSHVEIINSSSTLPNNLDKNGKSCVLALIIVPTRELSIQIQEILELFKIKSEIFIGGTKIEDDHKKVMDTSIAIGTPGRLFEIISSNSKVFSKLKYVVLDESDKLLSFGFEAKLQRILAFLPKTRFTGLFSATINESVNKLAFSFLKDPVTIIVTEKIPEKLNLKYLMVTPKEKIDTLIRLICGITSEKMVIPIKIKKSIVFFSTCNTTDYFYNLFIKILNYIKNNDLSPSFIPSNNDLSSSIIPSNNDLSPSIFPLHKIHGKMDQRDRNQIYSGFEKMGGALFCTDVAARGIDFKDVDLVVHFDVPKDHENIVHRSGRTARNGQSGDSIVFLMPNEKSMIDFLKLKGIAMEEASLAKYDDFDKSNVIVNETKNADDNKETKNTIHSKEVMTSKNTIHSKEVTTSKNTIHNEEVMTSKNTIHNEEVINASHYKEVVVPGKSIIIDSTQNTINHSDPVNISNLIKNKTDGSIFDQKFIFFNIGKSVMDKNLLTISVKSFVSYVRGYKEHILNYILDFKELDFDQLAEIHYLERIPTMAELKNLKFKNYEKPEQPTTKRSRR